MTSPAHRSGTMSAQALVAAQLRWLVAAGQTSLVANRPAGWLLLQAEPEPAPDPTPDPRPERSDPLQARAERPRPAPAALESRPVLARTLDALRAEVDAYDGCALKHTAMHTVFADGNPAARVLLIGEAPGADEDRRGLPFVGAAGQLLDRMMAAIGLDRHGPDNASFYLINMLYWRPPGNRTPTQTELHACLPLVRRHIELVRPNLILTLGNVPLQALFDPGERITRARGTWRTLDVDGRPVPLLPTFHPAYLLRTPAQKRFAWDDLLAFRVALDQQRREAGNRREEPSHAD